MKLPEHYLPDRLKARTPPRFKSRDGETWKSRHARRFRFARQSRQRFCRWCKHEGLTLTLRDRGERWVISIGDHVAEWWPRLAKLVLDGDHDNGIHTHDVNQLINELTRWIYATDTRQQHVETDGGDSAEWGRVAD